MKELWVRYLPPLFALVGVGLLGGTLAYWHGFRTRAVKSDQTTGTVIDHVERFGNDDGPVFDPVVEYFVGAARFTVRGKVGSSPKVKLGKKVTVHSDPMDPGKAYLVGDDIFALLVIGGLGAAFTIIGSLVWIFSPFK